MATLQLDHGLPPRCQCRALRCPGLHHQPLEESLNYQLLPPLLLRLAASRAPLGLSTSRGRHLQQSRDLTVRGRQSAATAEWDLAGHMLACPLEVQ